MHGRGTTASGDLAIWGGVARTAVPCCGVPPDLPPEAVGGQLGGVPAGARSVSETLRPLGSWTRIVLRKLHFEQLAPSKSTKIRVLKRASRGQKEKCKVIVASVACRMCA